MMCIQVYKCQHSMVPGYLANQSPMFMVTNSCDLMASVVVKDLRLKDEDKDKESSFKDKDKDLMSKDDVRPPSASCAATFSWWKRLYPRRRRPGNSSTPTLQQSAATPRDRTQGSTSVRSTSTSTSTPTPSGFW